MNEKTVAQLIAHRALHPGDGGVADAVESVPLGELMVRVVRQARRLRRAGVTRGTRVALAVESRPWTAIAVDYLSCVWLGAVPVLTGDAALLESIDGPVSRMDELVETEDGEHARMRREWPAPEDPLDVVFSSGTTGEPKATVSTHREWTGQPWPSTPSGARVLHYGIPFGTSTGVHGILLRHLATGVLSVAARNADEALALIDRFDCRELVLTPYSLRKLLAIDVPLETFDRIATVKIVAGPLHGRLASAAGRAFPTANILSIYGATELGPAIFTRLVNLGESTALGSPSPGTAARVVDGGFVCPPGAVGEIEVSHRFGAATTEQERTWIGTGDLGYADQLGRIYLVGRAKEILLLPTGRATPGAIEEHLLECGFVRDCGIVALDSTGEFDRLGACIVVEHPDKLDEVRAMLASFQPPLAKVRFVPAIPRTALGKPLRQRLWHLLTAPDDGPTGPATGPRNGCGCFPAGGGPR